MTRKSLALICLFALLTTGLSAVLPWRGSVSPLKAQVQPTLPVRETPTPTPLIALPPRLTPTSTAAVAPPSGGGDESTAHPPAGAYILLRAAPYTQSVWTVVQWQDSRGAWQAVKGWQGQLDELDELEQSSYKKWWVAPKDFGSGPFRWAVYELTSSQTATPIAVTAPFSLPTHSYQVLEIPLLANDTLD